MKDKYYYYVAYSVKDGKTTYIKGVTCTSNDDFPFLEVESDLAKHYRNSIDNIVITFYKEITEETYKTYNND